ncbi:uncharacterized protein MKZ38_004594 [Zalerion maritima]|uniref:Uncharacterized protein n=1 Tax=Zalerion maritima TaxID=339359 RepID=A0AAD5WWE4_9PEZI|nr:uncharacterized protein MKZ38_004594 [Zalerion maritima]
MTEGKPLGGKESHQRYCSVASDDLVGLKSVSAIVSKSLANELRLDLDPEGQKTLSLASGAKVRILGTVKLKWKFSGERRAHDILFDVLPQCVHDVVLGYKFLRITKTLTRFKHRIAKVLSSFMPVPGRISINLLGLEQQHSRVT